MRNKLIILSTIFLFSFTITIFGQKLVNSPYSRFNIGTMEPAGSFKSQAMGGLSVSLRDNSSIFFTNPASYSSLDTNSFVFDFGLDYSLNKLSDGTSHYSSDDMNFDHFIIGFPLAHGWGLAFGLIPLSNGYYKVSDIVKSTDPGYDPAVGEYGSSHSGDGGFSNFFIGSGIKLNKNLSAGINMTILFGQIKRTNQFDFADVYNVYNNNSTERLQLSGINLDYGLQYSIPLKNKHFFNTGVSLTTGKHFKSEYENFLFRYTATGSTDTMSYISSKSKSTFLPATFRAGISTGILNKFTAGVDFVASNWSEAVIPGSSGYTADTKKIIFGLEYTPDRASNYSYLKRMDYRLGGHAGGNYLVINGERVKEVGVSFGLGIPMRRSLSKTNLFFDYSKRSGSGANTLPVENYFTMGVSINLYDPFWFIKRKYD